LRAGLSILPPDSIENGRVDRAPTLELLLMVDTFPVP
jgi:hypothetical protein